MNIFFLFENNKKNSAFIANFVCDTFFRIIVKMSFSSYYGLVLAIVMSMSFVKSQVQLNTGQSNISSCYYCNNCSHPTTNVSMQCSPNAVYCYVRLNNIYTLKPCLEDLGIIKVINQFEPVIF